MPRFDASVGDLRISLLRLALKRAGLELAPTDLTRSAAEWKLREAYRAILQAHQLPALPTPPTASSSPIAAGPEIPEPTARLPSPQPGVPLSAATSARRVWPSQRALAALLVVLAVLTALVLSGAASWYLLSMAQVVPGAHLAPADSGGPDIPATGSES